MIAQRKKTFCINKNNIVAITIPNHDLKTQDVEIKYFTDCVYHSLVYSIPFSLEHTFQKQQNVDRKTQTSVNMNFEFLINQTKIHKKIFDNIGVINIKSSNHLSRFGILVTEEKGQIYVSLIQ